jgi:hypothetical protein
MCLVASIVLFTCVACSPNRFPSKTRTSPPSVPLYPDSQNSQVSIERQGEPLERLITRYQTSALPHDVARFYQDTLIRDGWKFAYEPNAKVMTFFNSVACPYYILFVDIDRSKAQDGSESTDVELMLQRDPCVGM